MDDTVFRILLADDDETDRMLFKEALEELEIKAILHTVNNGIRLMDYLNKKNIVLPQLLFLDLNMPRKNGLQCLKEIKSNERFKKILVAVYSTSASENDIEDTRINGANIYMKKPVDFQVFKQLLARAISTARESNVSSLAKDFFLLKA